jgi:hypothetical protein
MLSAQDTRIGPLRSVHANNATREPLTAPAPSGGSNATRLISALWIEHLMRTQKQKRRSLAEENPAQTISKSVDRRYSPDRSRGRQWRCTPFDARWRTAAFDFATAQLVDDEAHRDNIATIRCHLHRISDYRVHTD